MGFSISLNEKLLNYSLLISSNIDQARCLGPSYLDCATMLLQRSEERAEFVGRLTAHSISIRPLQSHRFALLFADEWPKVTGDAVET